MSDEPDEEDDDGDEGGDSPHARDKFDWATAGAALDIAGDVEDED